LGLNSFCSSEANCSGSAVAVHVGDEVRELRARFEQLVERVHLARHGRRREVVHAFEGDVHRQAALAREHVRHADRDTRLDGLHAIVEVIDIDAQELALIDRGQQLLVVARQIRHHAHDERDLHFFLCAVELDVVLDLHARRAIASYEFLTAWFCHSTFSMG